TLRYRKLRTHRVGAPVRKVGSRCASLRLTAASAACVGQVQRGESVTTRERAAPIQRLSGCPTGLPSPSAASAVAKLPHRRGQGWPGRPGLPEGATEGLRVRLV